MNVIDFEEKNRPSADGFLSSATSCLSSGPWKIEFAMEFMYDWENEGDRFSFDDSERFEEESICSWLSEPESLNNNWRGWKRQNGGQTSPIFSKHQGIFLIFILFHQRLCFLSIYLFYVCKYMVE